MIYLIGRALQLLALLVMPSAIWVGQFRHNEQGSILIFSGSILIFYLGLLLSRKGA